MNAPSSKAVIKNGEPSPFRVLILVITMASLLIFLWLSEGLKPDPFLQDTLKHEGSLSAGNNLFKMNCVGCHGISAQGLVGPDLHEVTTRLSDKKIVNQVVKGLTPPMPSFEIDSQSMADLLAYMHSLR